MLLAIANVYIAQPMPALIFSFKLKIKSFKIK